MDDRIALFLTCDISDHQPFCSDYFHLEKSHIFQVVKYPQWALKDPNLSVRKERS